MRSRSLTAALAIGSLTVLALAPTAFAAKKTTKKPAKAAPTTAAPTTKPAPATTAAPAPATTAAPAAASSTGGATLADLKKAGKIRIGIKQNVPLIGLKNPVTNQYSGFDVEISKIVAKAIFGSDKDKIEWVDASVSANRIPFITDNKADIVIATFSITDARKGQIDMAGPYYIAGQDILTYKVELANIKGPDDLNGRKVCVQSASTSLTQLKAAAPKAVITELPGVAECVEALKDGRVDAVSTDDALLTGYAEKFPAFGIVGKQFSVEKYGIGLKKGDTDFRNYINDVIEASYKDGSWKKAVESTLGNGGLKTPTPPAVDRYAPIK
jgi:glutamate transport system substrate-binding protein